MRCLDDSEKKKRRVKTEERGYTTTVWSEIEARLSLCSLFFFIVVLPQNRFFFFNVSLVCLLDRVVPSCFPLLEKENTFVRLTFYASGNYLFFFVCVKGR